MKTPAKNPSQGDLALARRLEALRSIDGRPAFPLLALRACVEKLSMVMVSARVACPVRHSFRVGQIAGLLAKKVRIPPASLTKSADESTEWRTVFDAEVQSP